jgi:Domain of unknown function (DUF4845)
MHKRIASFRRQRGVTAIGWVCLLIPVALVLYAGIRLTPVYLNYMRVARSLSQIADEAKGDDSTNANSLRVALDKRLDIEGVEYPATKDFIIRKDGQAWIMEISYEEAAPYVSNVALLVTFRKSVQIGSTSKGVD